MKLEIYFRETGKRKWQKSNLDWAINYAFLYGNRSIDEFINEDLEDNEYITYGGNRVKSFQFKKVK